MQGGCNNEIRDSRTRTRLAAIFSRDYRIGGIYLSHVQLMYSRAHDNIAANYSFLKNVSSALEKLSLSNALFFALTSPAASPSNV